MSVSETTTTLDRLLTSSIDTDAEHQTEALATLTQLEQKDPATLGTLHQ